MTKEEIIDSYIEKIEIEKIAFISLSQSLLESMEGNITETTIFFLGYFSRIVNLLDGITYTIKTENITVAGGLLRMLLETLHVLNYLIYHPSRDGDYFKNFLKYGRVVKLKSNGDTEDVSHQTMLNHLSKQYPELKNIWDETNHFVHFSKKANHLIFSEINGNNFSIHVGVGNPAWYETNEMKNFVLSVYRICRILNKISSIQIELVLKKHSKKSKK